MMIKCTMTHLCGEKMDLKLGGIIVESILDEADRI